MSMTQVAAKAYIAGIVGGRASQQVLDTAAEILLRAFQDWQNARNWRFLLKDTSATTAITGCTATGASASVNAPTAGAFDPINVGQTVTISSGTATLAADTTVSSITRGSDGVVTSITLSAAFGGTTNANATLTFSADIPVLVGVSEYNLPSDFNSAYSAVLLLHRKGKLAYIDQRMWDVYQDDQSVSLPVDGYMTYNPVSPATQNYGTQRLKLVGNPDAVNTLRLRYYRRFNTTGTSIDMPDEYLYQFLDYARGLYIAAKRAQDNPGEFLAGVTDAFVSAKEDDDEPDEDEDQRMKSPYEANRSRPIVGNGQFSPYPWD